ncbi:hypothetical protein GCM10027184_70190 [Saccharothrix stipae]
MPLLRFTSTYHAVVSTVAADAAVVTTESNPPTNATAAAAANPDRNRRRHLAERANPTDIAVSFPHWDRRPEAGRIGAGPDDTRARTTAHNTTC